MPSPPSVTKAQHLPSQLLKNTYYAWYIPTPLNNNTPVAINWVNKAYSVKHKEKSKVRTFCLFSVRQLFNLAKNWVATEAPWPVFGRTKTFDFVLFYMVLFPTYDYLYCRGKKFVPYFYQDPSHYFAEILINKVSSGAVHFSNAISSSFIELIRANIDSKYWERLRIFIENKHNMQ